MKRIKFLVLIVLALSLVSSVLFACSEITEDHTTLLEAGNIYRVAYDADGGGIGGAREAFMYYKSLIGIKFADPSPDEGNFQPTKPEQYIKRWYYKEIEHAKDSKGNDIEIVNKVEWNFKRDVFTQELVSKALVELVDEKTGITFYEFRVYPEWEYSLYVDYCISYVDVQDKNVSVGTLQDSTGDVVVNNDFAINAEDLPSYLGDSVTHSSGVAVPEDYEEIKYANIVSSSQIKQMYYADAALTKRITFPLDSSIAPRPEKGKNRIKIYVKFFNVPFTVLAAPGDLRSFGDANYYLWRDIDFNNAKVDAASLFEEKVFVGNGFKISNLIINSKQASASIWNMGMFGNIINSEIRDVTFENCSIYYNMTHNISPRINCGLLAGSISGSNTNISNVSLIDCRGYVRSNISSLHYNAEYSQDKQYLYNNVITEYGTPTIASTVTTRDVSINYFNMHLEPVDSRNDTGFTVWNSTNVSSGLLLQFGGLNEELKSRAADASVGRPEGYYLGVDIWLTEIDDVYLEIFGSDPISAESIGSTVLQKDGWTIMRLNKEDNWYVYRMYVSESIKGGKVVVDWNGAYVSEPIIDTYNYLVTGGSGDIENAREIASSNSISLDYDQYSQTLTYGENNNLVYYTPEEETSEEGTSPAPIRTRPEGYSIPMRVNLFSNIAVKENEPTTVTIEDNDGTTRTYNIATDVEIKTRNGVAHYFEFWQPVTPTNASRTLTIRFYDRYSLVINIVPSDEVTFVDPTPAPAPALNAQSQAQEAQIQQIQSVSQQESALASSVAALPNLTFADKLRLF